jgi:hypothetical protein
MQMAQISQRGAVLVAHPARKIRVIQPLIPRGFRHILQHSQPLLNRLPAFRGHLPPLRQNIIGDVRALLRRHPSPHLRAIAKHLLLSWRKTPEALLILEHPLLFLRRHIPPALLHVGRRCRYPSPVSILIRMRSIPIPALVILCGSVVASFSLPVARRTRRTVLGHTLRRSTRHRQCQRRAEPQPTQPSAELASKFHRTYMG